LKKILFILHKRDQYQSWSLYNYDNFSSGLSNSVNFITQMLKSEKFDTKQVEVIDNNEIDHEISIYNPDIVILEALWVVPDKLNILSKLYPSIEFIIRLHSETPFIANEGIAIEWIFNYIKINNVYIAANSERLYSELKYLYESNNIKSKLYYLPNYYYSTKLKFTTKLDCSNYFVCIGCFGAIRPLKNQLIQAIAAIKFAEDINKELIFYINGTREELQGSSVLKNIRALFNNSKHTLIEIDWLDHSSFLSYIKNNIDIGMQVSFTETFNIVSADLISQSIPIVTSNEVKFASKLIQANCTDVDDIVNKLHLAYNFKFITLINSFKLKLQSKKTKKVWLKYFK
jgi:hypothetical protein